MHTMASASSINNIPDCHNYMYSKDLIIMTEVSKRASVISLA